MLDCAQARPGELAVLSRTAVQGFDDVSVATIGLCVCRALDYMHSRGRIHRDIKVSASSEGHAAVWTSAYPARTC